VKVLAEASLVQVVHQELVVIVACIVKIITWMNGIDS
jgi:hypothetical protein